MSIRQLTSTTCAFFNQMNHNIFVSAALTLWLDSENVIFGGVPDSHVKAYKTVGPRTESDRVYPGCIRHPALVVSTIAKAGHFRLSQQ